MAGDHCTRKLPGAKQLCTHQLMQKRAVAACTLASSPGGPLGTFWQAAMHNEGIPQAHDHPIRQVPYQKAPFVD